MGNRLVEAELGESPVIYKPNLLNQYLTVGNESYVYDSAGNLIGDGTYNYSYNYRNQLASVQSATSNAVVLLLNYDSMGGLAKPQVRVLQQKSSTTA